MWYSKIISGYLHHYLYIHFLKSFRNVSYQDLKLLPLYCLQMLQKEVKEACLTALTFLNSATFTEAWRACASKVWHGQDRTRRVPSPYQLISSLTLTSGHRHSATHCRDPTACPKIVSSSSVKITYISLLYSLCFSYAVYSRTDQIHGRHAKDMCLQTRGYPCKFRVPTPFQTCS